jgi:hypothetical protein
MQNGMNEKNRTALERWGARKILGDLVNVLSVMDTPGMLNVLSSQDSECGVRAEEFLRKYGPLRAKESVSDVLEYARRFRQAWWATTESDYQDVNSMLDDLFLSNPFSRQIVGADFASGKWEPRPRTLLGYLAVTLMRSRKMLHRCERPECRRYFIKEFSRDRYCKTAVRPTCGEIMREKSQTEWAHDHRDSLKARRRKQKKVFKRDVPLRKQ